ncbi:MATE family efflux transporter [Turicibacter sanguinis]|uniref:MATE family efflux transporter n=1 Tax=Turicibacter sanguinis TaxID=154288 RepID=UPI00232AC8F0|nr:MATE family efflux transporter [Turicibacter sanguinis]MDB8542570.1 MATE family efflux transporter [Turicibacter sanguinis]
MEKRLDLTKGHIIGTLVKLALPIMGTSFIQMAYNLTDMIWIGRVGSSAVAAVGTAGFFTWLAMAFIMISKIGAEIKVSQTIGAHLYEETKGYVRSAIQINLILAVLYMMVLFFFKEPLIGFFNLGDEEIIQMSYTYLEVMIIGMIFYFINPVFTAIFNGSGDSKTPFMINTIGLIFNIVFDPILILGFGPIPALGVLGAAIATVCAQIVVSLCFLVIILRSKAAYLKLNLFEKFDIKFIKIICKIGFPGALQSGLFTCISMVLGRLVAAYGAVPIAVQKVGSQIESISWMTAGGFSTALGAFVGQNYGAKQFDRIQKGYQTTMLLALGLGVFATVLLVFFGEPIFSFFLPEAEAIEQGKMYLKILGYSQLFMCIEITTQGLFNGLGRTYIPSIVGIILTGARIPLAYVIGQPHVLGIDGVWWAITLSSVVKGLVLAGIYFYLSKRQRLYLKQAPSTLEGEGERSSQELKLKIE